MPSNPDVISLLEDYLKQAKRGKFEHVIIGMTGRPNLFAGGYAGEVLMEVCGLEASQILHSKLRNSIENWSLPPRDPHLDFDHVVYNIAANPLGFDFLVWLVHAEMRRVQYRCPAPLKVGFWEGRDPKELINPNHRHMWLDNVFRPVLPLLGAVESEHAKRGWSNGVFVPRAILDLHKEGYAVPQLNSIKKSDFPGYVTVTLREANHTPHRNSRLDDWRRFAKLLEDKGEKVLFLRDTAKADDPVEGFPICPEGSRDIQTRMSVYAEAKMNFFVSNGPVGLCLFSAAPWMQFITVEDEHSTWLPDTPKFWHEHVGFGPGGQYPWANANQRIVWKPDRYENLVEAWQSFQMAEAA